ncbi:unnamed protein product [Durusdinium trenchii]|uniref:Chloroplastic (AtLPPE2) (Phosphatidic acid phosphatase epsilon 2) (Plastidic phosphatidic acid phosphatase epsilon 2) n=2 Tax=Durusdinium trenchii TaxID=1381693 RepID=A0ABP0R2Y4_9DINO
MGHGLLHHIDAGTKWLVSGAVFGVLLWRQDSAICWCVLGSVGAAANCKCLKVLINQSRPRGARKVDPGMPSSHAQSLGFLSIYFALDVAFPFSGPAQRVPTDSGRAAWAGMLVAGGLFGSWLRVAMGFHTTAQVAVGYALGAASAVVWQSLYGYQVLPHLTPLLLRSLQGATVLAGGLFAVKVLSDVAKDHRRE